MPEVTVCLYRDDWIKKLDTNCLSSSDRVEVSRHCVTEDECVERGWSLIGDACHESYITNAVPDVFLLSLILFLGTFTVAMTFRMFRTSRFFPTAVRINASFTVAAAREFLSSGGIDHIGAPFLLPSLRFP